MTGGWHRVASNAASTGEVWKVWTSNATGTCNHVVWKGWIRETYSSTTTATSASYHSHHDAIWYAWNVGKVRGEPGYDEEVRRARAIRQAYVPTAEEKARQELYAEQARREAAEREKAKERAMSLLMASLTPVQREELKTKGHFHCKSQQGRKYRIYRGSHGNVKALDDAGKEVESLCIQPAGVPEGDILLAQKLDIEMNEIEFRRTANITRLQLH